MVERGFIDVMSEALNAVAPGLKNLGPEIGAELSRLGTQGSLEMAQALFNGAAFTPYGPGQYKQTPELDNGGPTVEPDLQQEHGKGGREM